MQGPEGAAERVRAWLEQRIPARLTRLETTLGLEPGSLPTPGLVAAQDRGPIGLEEWPAVLVLPQRLTDLELLDVLGDGSELYRAGYLVRVLIWVRADDYDTTDLLRKRYLLAVRTALLERKALAARPAAGADPTADVAIRPETLVEDYSDVFADDAGRTIAGGYVELVVTVNELLEGEDAAPGTPTADDLTVAETGDTSAIPQHPALS